VAPQPVLDRLWGRRYISMRRPDTVSSPDGVRPVAIVQHWFVSPEAMCRTKRQEEAQPLWRNIGARDLHWDYSATQGGSCTQ